MESGDKIWLGVILLLAGWFFFHERNLSRGAQALGDELLDVGLKDLATGLFG